MQHSRENKQKHQKPSFHFTLQTLIVCVCYVQCFQWQTLQEEKDPYLRISSWLVLIMSFYNSIMFFFFFYKFQKADLRRRCPDQIREKLNEFRIDMEII